MNNTGNLNNIQSEAHKRLEFVIYRPHANIWFKNTVGRILKKKLLPNKYTPLLEYLIKADVDVYFSSSLLQYSTPKVLVKSLFDIFELVMWFIFNKIDFKKINFIFTKKSLENKDALFLMHYGNLTYETEDIAVKGKELAENLTKIKILKIVHLTHYAYCSITGSNNLALLKPDLLVAENNLKDNSKYYNKYFENIGGKFLCLPYTPADRFKKLKPFSQRINKLVVTGSITYKMKSPEFIDFFAADELQPMRRKLYEEAAQYHQQMDCMVSDLDASRKINERIKMKDLFFNRIKKITSVAAQADYYKKDIVDIYNSYSMFAVPEEICDLPAIGFVEGMACGSVYFGLDDPMYRDIGMQPGIHYVSYDGTVTDLMTKVDFYQQNTAELIKIADEGYKFVINCLNPSAVYGKFINQLEAATMSQKTDL